MIHYPFHLLNYESFGITPSGTPKHCPKLRLAGFLDRVEQDYLQRQMQEERGTKAGIKIVGGNQ